MDAFQVMEEHAPCFGHIESPNIKGHDADGIHSLEADQPNGEKRGGEMGRRVKGECEGGEGVKRRDKESEREKVGRCGEVTPGSATYPRDPLI